MGSTVIVLQLGIITVPRCGMYRNAIAPCTALSSQMSTSSSNTMAIFGSPCFEQVSMLSVYQGWLPPAHETPYKSDDIGAAVTLSGIVNSYNENLVARAPDGFLKERR